MIELNQQVFPRFLSPAGFPSSRMNCISADPVIVFGKGDETRSLKAFALIVS